MTSWFDLLTLDAAGPEDERGIKRAGELINGMIDGEVKQGIIRSESCLAGFLKEAGFPFMPVSDTLNTCWNPCTVLLVTHSQGVSRSPECSQ